MMTAIVAALAFVGGYMAHKVQWHIKARNELKTAFEEFKDSLEEKSDS